MGSVVNPRSVSSNLDRAEDSGLYFNKGDQILRDLTQLFGYDFEAVGQRSGNLQSSPALTEAGFSGWGSEIGVRQNFDAVRFFIYPHNSQFIPTQATILIREASGTGTILAQTTIPLPRLGIETATELLVELGSVVANADAEEVYLQVWTDGICGYLPSSETPANLVRYATDRDITFTGEGIAVASSRGEIFARTFLSESANPYTSGNFNTVRHEAGGFTGFGTPLSSVPSVLNYVETFIRVADAGNIPTRCRIRFRDTGHDGEILATTVTDLNVTQLGETALVRFVFESSVDLSGYASVWCELAADGNIAFPYSTVNSGSSAERYSGARSIDADIDLPLAGATGRQLYIRTLNQDRGRGYRFNFQSMLKEIRSGESGSLSYTPETDILLPPKMFGAEGIESNIYLDGAIDSHVPLASLRVKGGTSSPSTGQMESHRFTYTPAGDGSHAVSLEVFNNGASLKSASTSLIYKAASAGSGQSRKCLIIGDSITAGGAIVTQIQANIAAASGTYDCSFLGTQDGGTTEGRSGWRYNTFLTDATSPFWDGSAFSFSHYMTDNSFSMASGDHVFCLLGTNDLFNYTDDVSLASALPIIGQQVQDIIDSIHSYESGLNIWLGLVPQPASGQTAWGETYGGTNDWEWRVKRNYAKWRRYLIDTFKDSESSNIRLCPVNFCVDTVNNYKTKTRQVNARNTATETYLYDPVHPSTAGEEQIGDVVYACLLSTES